MMTQNDESDRGDGPKLTHPPRLVRFVPYGRGPLLWFSRNPLINNRGIYLNHSAHLHISLSCAKVSPLSSFSVYRIIDCWLRKIGSTILIIR